MAQNVKFIAVKLQETYDALATKDALALYWIQDSKRLYKGDELYGVGLAATADFAGLMSAEDKAKLDALIVGDKGLSGLTPVDGTIAISDTEDGGKAIGVAVSTQKDNALVVVDDGLFVPKAKDVVVPEFSIEKQTTAEEGFATSYKLKRVVGEEVTYVGDVINIAKDMVLQSATLETVVESDVPYAGAVVGDPYIKMAFNDTNASSLYIPVKGLVDAYTAGDGIEIVDNKIAVKLAEVAHGLAAVDGVLTLNLATTESDGAMSKEDKKMLDAIPTVYEARKYEIASKPEGTIVDYRDKEIRVMCPADTEWKMQTSGAGADANSYYIGFKAYAPANAVSFKEDLKETIKDDTMYYFENNDFAGVDIYGRKYSIVWLPVARFDGSAWIYYGATSTATKYIGWYYTVKWYNAHGKMVGADQIRINLSNEDTHMAVAPSYVNEVMTPTEAKEIKDTVAAMEEAYTWASL